MIFMLHLDLGAGPDLSMGGLSPMRRPAQHRPGLAAARGWAHPYTGLTGMSVFYNDGGQAGPPAQPAPSPANMPPHAGQQPPAPAPPASAPAQDLLLDKDTGQPMTQARFAKIMTRENDKGRMKVLKELCEQAGVPFDHENTNVAQLAQVLKEAETARQAQLSDEQRRNEDLTAREQALQAREQAAAQREADAARRDRDSRIRAALVSLGATGDDLEDAAALIRVADDADDTAIQQAADALKARRTELFAASQPQQLPPAPSGGPAAGGVPRPPTAGKDAVQQAARDRARAMGLRTDDAA